MTFACVLRSSEGRAPFSPVWVERLCRQAAEHLKPDRIVCLSDLEDFPRMGEVRVSSLLHDWPGWWSKIEIFRPGLFSGPCVYADLDTLICGPIPSLALRIEYRGSLMLLDDFYAPQRPASGFMAWTPNEETGNIYRDFAADPAKGMKTRHGDGGFIGQYGHARLQRVFPGRFASFKAHKLDHGPAGFPIVCFHGFPKNNMFPADHWVTRHWEGR